jgi:hypothetical protein
VLTRRCNGRPLRFPDMSSRCCSGPSHERRRVETRWPMQLKYACLALCQRLAGVAFRFGGWNSSRYFRLILKCAQKLKPRRLQFKCPGPECKVYRLWLISTHSDKHGRHQAPTPTRTPSLRVRIGRLSKLCLAPTYVNYNLVPQ